jgi:ABC-type multidrug transport system fused ATPase/permease subunit
VQLIERYYDALEGVLTIDGVDVRGSFENQRMVALIFPH